MCGSVTLLTLTLFPPASALFLFATLLLETLFERTTILLEAGHFGSFRFSVSEVQLGNDSGRLSLAVNEHDLDGIDEVQLLACRYKRVPEDSHAASLEDCQFWTVGVGSHGKTVLPIQPVRNPFH